MGGEPAGHGRGRCQVCRGVGQVPWGGSALAKVTFLPSSVIKELALVNEVNWPVRHGLSEHVAINKQVKVARANRSKVAQHNVLGHAAHGVDLGVGSSLQQNVHCLLKAGTHERARALAVDAVASDGHEAALVCHDIAQQG